MVKRDAAGRVICGEREVGIRKIARPITQILPGGSFGVPGFEVVVSHLKFIKMHLNETARHIGADGVEVIDEDRARALFAKYNSVTRVAQELPASKTFVYKPIRTKDLPELRNNARGVSLLDR